MSDPMSNLLDQEERESLTPGQLKAISLALEGKDNLFITGAAGSGKSTVIRHIVKMGNAMGKNVLVCAPTGVAAMNFDAGMTIHAAFGFKSEPCLTGKGKEGIQFQIKAPKLIKAASIIIVDEISMAGPFFLDCIVLSLRKAEELSGKKKELIVVGDFAQLPPVVPSEDPIRKLYTAVYGKYENWYAFMGLHWDECRFKVIYLNEVVRQRDRVFADKLNQIRKGDFSDLDYINTAASRVPDESVVALYAHKQKVYERNLTCLGRLESELHTNKTTICYEDGSTKRDLAGYLQSSIPQDLSYKVGASILFTATDYDGSCSAYAMGGRSRIPGRPNFVNGMAGTILDAGEDTVIIKTERGEMLQVSPMTRPIYDTRLVNGRFVRHKVASYSQFPFDLAYAQTIHRAQGVTLSKVSVCPDTFSPAQLYVALSRVTSIDGLYLTRRIEPKDLKVDPVVLSFYERIEKLAGVSNKKGRPVSNVDGSRRSTYLYVPKALEAHVKEEIRLNRFLGLKEYPAPVPGRVHVRVPEKLFENIKGEIQDWKKKVSTSRTNSKN